MKTIVLAAIIVIFSGVSSSCHKLSLKNFKTATAVVSELSNVRNTLATAD